MAGAGYSSLSPPIPVLRDSGQGQRHELRTGHYKDVFKAKYDCKEEKIKCTLSRHPCLLPHTLSGVIWITGMWTARLNCLTQLLPLPSSPSSTRFTTRYGSTKGDLLQKCNDFSISAGAPSLHHLLHIATSNRNDCHQTYPEPFHPSPSSSLTLLDLVLRHK